jgi:hypothetical protein
MSRSAVVQEILQSARIEDLKRAARLVASRPLTMALPKDPKRRAIRLRALVVAERRRSAALLDSIGDAQER